jgi:hypothetical protein
MDRVFVYDFFAFCREVLPREIAENKRNELTSGALRAEG